jgi:hypothetical protein
MGAETSVAHTLAITIWNARGAMILVSLGQFTEVHIYILRRNDGQQKPKFEQ